MLDNLLMVAGQVLALFLMILVGFVLGRKGFLSKKGLDELSFLLLYVVTVCVIINSFQTPKNPELVADILICAGAGIGYYVLTALATAPLFRRQTPDTGTVLRFGVMYSNVGFMGLPLVRAVLGEEAAVFAVMMVGIFNVAQWTHGAFVMGGRKAISVLKVFTSPGVVGMTVGLLLFFTGTTLPSPVATAISSMAALNTPLAMVIIGAQMASSRASQVFTRPILYGAAALRLLVIPLIFALALLPLKMNPLSYCTLVILSATASAGATSLFAQKFDRDTSTAACFITLSSLLSIVTLPFITVIAQYLSG